MVQALAGTDLALSRRISLTVIKPEVRVEEDIRDLRARYERAASNPFGTKEYEEAVPLVLHWLKAKIEQGRVEKANYLTAAKVCLPVQHSLYLELLNLWSKPDAIENLAVVNKMVEQNPII